MKIVVATTLAAYVMDQPDTWESWLRTANEMEEIAESRGDEVVFFAALQLDARGTEPFVDLVNDDRLTNYWTYQLDDGRIAVTTANRLRHITAGQNFCNDYAQSVNADYMLFMAADCMPPADAPWKLIEASCDFGAKIVGGEVATYCLSGPEVAPLHWPGYAISGAFDAWKSSPGYYQVQAHMPTAAFVLLSREAFRKLRWRWDSDTGMTDDPCLYHDATKVHGWNVVVRKDVIGKHYPESIGAIETRGHDMRVER